MNLALMRGMDIINDAITINRRKKIHVIHEVPEHSEWCETMNIPTDHDFTNWNDELQAWQCQFCQRVYDVNTKRFITEEERKGDL